METFFLTLSFAVLLASLYTALLSFAKKPRSLMKNSFAIFCLVLFSQNLFFLLDRFECIQMSRNFSLGLDYLLFATSLGFASHFPNYFRNMPILNQMVAFFLGGLAFSYLGILLHSEEVLDISREILILVYFAMGFVVYKKTWKYFTNIRSFLVTLLLLYFIVILSYIAMIYLEHEHFLAKLPEPVLVWNLAYASFFLAFLLHFTFREEYISIPISTLWERSRNVLERVEPASPKGTERLKAALLEYYESSHLKEFLEEFSFRLLVDETVDNALEHGGKRSYDDITVYVYESKKFTDVYVIDRGKGFNPKKVPSPLRADRKMIPSGRGIHLLKELYQVRWNFLGNEIRIRILNPPQKSR